MTPEVCNAALQFLARVELKGVEVETFIAVCQAIRQDATPPASAAAEPEPAAVPVVRRKRAVKV